MRLAFYGSRILDGKKVQEIIAEEVVKHNPEYIVTCGEADGVCRQTREYARRFGIPLKLHFLNHQKAQGKYWHRAAQVMGECDHCVFIHDGCSQGTKNGMAILDKLGKPSTCHIIADEGLEFPEQFEEDWLDSLKETFLEAEKLNAK